MRIDGYEGMNKMEIIFPINTEELFLSEKAINVLTELLKGGNPEKLYPEFLEAIKSNKHIAKNSIISLAERLFDKVERVEDEDDTLTIYTKSEFHEKMGIHGLFIPRSIYEPYNIKIIFNDKNGVEEHESAHQLFESSKIVRKLNEIEKEAFLKLIYKIREDIIANSCTKEDVSHIVLRNYSRYKKELSELEKRRLLLSEAFAHYLSKENKLKEYMSNGWVEGRAIEEYKNYIIKAYGDLYEKISPEGSIQARDIGNFFHLLCIFEDSARKITDSPTKYVENFMMNVDLDLKNDYRKISDELAEKFYSQLKKDIQIPL